jgi:chorismate-pyruvate lyase
MNTQEARHQSPAFDPAEGFFKAQSHRPANLEGVDLGGISPLLRAMLVIDGTVTTFLEAYVLEPVEIQVLGQKVEPLGEDHRWLEIRAGERIINRSVMLLGRETGQVYAWAESIIVHGRLGSSIRQGLEQEPGGLGRILVDSELESRREGLWYGRERVAEMPGPVQKMCNGDFLTRAYRLIAGGVPMMMITERFPIPAGRTSATG